MPRSYQVRITPVVAQQLQEIFDYIAADSPENARLMISRIVNSIDSLELFPHRFKVVKNSEAVHEELRSMLVKPYLVRYHVHEEHGVVTVVSVRHGARSPE